MTEDTAEFRDCARELEMVFVRRGDAGQKEMHARFEQFLSEASKRPLSRLDLLRLHRFAAAMRMFVAVDSGDRDDVAAAWTHSQSLGFDSLREEVQQQLGLALFSLEHGDKEDSRRWIEAATARIDRASDECRSCAEDVEQFRKRIRAAFDGG